MQRLRGNPAAFEIAGQGDHEQSLCDRPARSRYRSRRPNSVNARLRAKRGVARARLSQNWNNVRDLTEEHRGRPTRPIVTEAFRR
jgi:hypothetical protein